MAFSYAVIWALQMLASCWFLNSVQAMNTVIEERELFIKVQGASRRAAVRCCPPLPWEQHPLYKKELVVVTTHCSMSMEAIQC